LNKNVKIYNASSVLRNPKYFLYELINDVRLSIPLAWQLFKRDISLSYKQSFLGYFWAFLPSVVITVGFVGAVDAKVISMQEMNIPYGLYVMLGTILWQTFLEAFNGPIGAITSSKGILAKVNFPRASIIFSKMGEVVFNFIVKVPLLVFILIYYKVAVSWEIIYSIGGVLSIVLLGFFLGTLLAPAAVIYQDINRLVSVVMVPWFFITPVVFMTPQSGWLSSIISLNPVAILLSTTRNFLVGDYIGSDISIFLILSSFTVAGCVFSYVLYKMIMPFILERVSA
jgi:lipopolysaccharide transport system permease protein